VIFCARRTSDCLFAIACGFRNRAIRSSTAPRAFRVRADRRRERGKNGNASTGVRSCCWKWGSRTGTRSSRPTLRRPRWRHSARRKLGQGQGLPTTTERASSAAESGCAKRAGRASRSNEAIIINGRQAAMDVQTFITASIAPEPLPTPAWRTSSNGSGGHWRCAALTGRGARNLVPVDWVARRSGRILVVGRAARPDDHLTSPGLFRRRIKKSRKGTARRSRGWSGAGPDGRRQIRSLGYRGVLGSASRNMAAVSSRTPHVQRVRQTRGKPCQTVPRRTSMSDCYPG